MSVEALRAQQERMGSAAIVLARALNEPAFQALTPREVLLVLLGAVTHYVRRDA